MYKHILIPVAFDHADSAENSIKVAQKLLAADGRLSILHVMEEMPGYVSAYLPEGTMEANRADALARLTAMAKNIGKNGAIAVVRGHANRTIVSYAEEHDADCIVIASHKPGLEDYFLGSTAAHVVRHAKCSVHVIR